MPYSHDGDYKDIFSHPEMIRDLLLEFVPGEWLRHVDFATLERVNGSYVSETGRLRHDDMVWKVRLASETWLYVYVLLEFQSEPDRWMALRLLVYVGLLYQDLVKRNDLSPQGKLPPVLPIVLYNGKQRWTAAGDLAELTLTAPAGLTAFQPAQRYLLIDEGAFDPEVLDSKANLAAALFRLEHSRTPDDLRRVIASLKGWLGAPEQLALRQSLKRWALRSLRRKLKDDSIPEVADLTEIDSLLAERIESWTEEWKRQGLEAGLQQGLQQGLKQGLQQGLVEGRLQGEALLLQRLLESRFGQLPAWVQDTLTRATETQLLGWSERIFDAPTLERLFAP